MLNLILCFLAAVQDSGVIDNIQGGEQQPINTTTTTVTMNAEAFYAILIIGLFAIILTIILVIARKNANKEIQQKQQKKD